MRRPEEAACRVLDQTAAIRDSLTTGVVHHAGEAVVVEDTAQQATMEAAAAADIHRVQASNRQRQSHIVSGMAVLRIIMLRMQATEKRIRPTMTVLAAIVIKGTEAMKVRLIRLPLLSRTFFKFGADGESIVRDA